jgi:hypothetical protein
MMEDESTLLATNLLPEELNFGLYISSPLHLAALHLT